MKFIKNEKGVTLIEILAAIVILSIIVVSILNLFPQMGFLNQVNGDKAQAINTAKQVLIDWQNDEKVKNFLSGKSPAVTEDYHDDAYYYFKTTKGRYDVVIKIRKNPDLGEPTPSLTNPVKAYFIQVQLTDAKNIIKTETYGYITF